VFILRGVWVWVFIGVSRLVCHCFVVLCRIGVVLRSYSLLGLFGRVVNGCVLCGKQ